MRREQKSRGSSDVFVQLPTRNAAKCSCRPMAREQMKALLRKGDRRPGSLGDDSPIEVCSDMLLWIDRSGSGWWLELSRFSGAPDSLWPLTCCPLYTAVTKPERASPSHSSTDGDIFYPCCFTAQRFLEIQNKNMYLLPLIRHPWNKIAGLELRSNDDKLWNRTWQLNL